MRRCGVEAVEENAQQLVKLMCSFRLAGGHASPVVLKDGIGGPEEEDLALLMARAFDADELGLAGSRATSMHALETAPSASPASTRTTNSSSVDPTACDAVGGPVASTTVPHGLREGLCSASGSGSDGLWSADDRAPSRFEPGLRDNGSAFVMSQRFYGRSSEVDVLDERLSEVAQGAVHLCLLSGHSGIGKTALVQEVWRPVASKQGLCVKGKFDQYNRNTPYSAISEGFTELIEYFLTGSDEVFLDLRRRLLELLRGRGQLVVDVLPDLVRIIGPQPPVNALSIEDAKRRRAEVFADFVQVKCCAPCLGYAAC